jgi:hypothetical protein
MLKQTMKKDIDKGIAHSKMEQKMRMSMPIKKVVPKMKLKPTYIIPDQMKVKNIGVGWGGEKPIQKKVVKKVFKK